MADEHDSAFVPLSASSSDVPTTRICDLQHRSRRQAAARSLRAVFQRARAVVGRGPRSRGPSTSPQSISSSAGAISTSRPSRSGDGCGRLLRALAAGWQWMAAMRSRRKRRASRSACARPFGESDTPACARRASVPRVVGGVADEEERRGHGARSARSGFARPRSRSVRSRASASVNCCGGDFMK